MNGRPIIDALAVPFWQADALPALPSAPLPAQADVVIVGAGYTGLSAAREIAAAGRSVLALEAGAIGTGCSGRNGGQAAYSIKPSFATLRARYGAERALGICREGHAALAHLRAIAVQSDPDCSWRPHGCFVGAHSARHFRALVREAEDQPQGLEQAVTVVPRSEQRGEIASDFYRGGCVYPADGSVDPMRLLLTLFERASAAGASVIEHCEVKAIRRIREAFEVATARGVVRARDVMIATNGYSGPLSPWHRRRVIPIGSYQIATERLGRDAVRALIPNGRNIVDTRRVVVYYRPSPDGERIIFGGRAALAEHDPQLCAPRLRAMMCEVFPQLAGARITHAWVGWVAFTFDTLPHLGRRDGVYYCMGYCGSGVTLAPYLGARVGQQIVGSPSGKTAFDDLPFPSRPYYFGKPWFLAPSVFVYRALDRLGI